jgi:hypothetical protein
MEIHGPNSTAPDAQKARWQVSGGVESVEKVRNAL